MQKKNRRNSYNDSYVLIYVYKLIREPFITLSIYHNGVESPSVFVLSLLVNE